MRISHTMNLRDLAERTGDAELEEYKLEYIRERLCAMRWEDTSEVPEDSWLNILDQATKEMPVYSVEECAHTGAWLHLPVVTGETSTFIDWCRRADTESERFDHYEHSTEYGETETRLVRSKFVG